MVEERVTKKKADNSDDTEEGSVEKDPEDIDEGKDEEEEENKKGGC